MMGDNKIVVINFSFNSNNLKKKHKFIAYHCTRKAVDAGVIKLYTSLINITRPIF